MTYLINSTRLTRVLIGGVNVTDQVSDITLSDSSGLRNGLIATDGEIKLGYRPGTPEAEDYRRNTFVRGEVVDLFVTYPDGVERKHPRGRLFIIDSKFNPEDESFLLNVGCGMAIHALDGNIDEIKGLPNFYIPSTRQNYSSISSALAAEGRIAWYDAEGILQSEKLWSGETFTTSPPAQWVSVFGVTALAVSTINSVRTIRTQEDAVGNPYEGGDPDNIQLSYEYLLNDGEIDPATGLVNSDDSFVTETSVSTSNYYTQYPVIHYQRVQKNSEPTLDEAGEPEDDTGLSDPRPSDCSTLETESSNPASAGDGGGAGNGDTNCMDNYETARIPLYVGVSSKSETQTFYRGPGGTRDQVITRNFGPALDANNQYYGDLYQLCRQSWATRCNPNGYCSTSAGRTQAELSRSIQTIDFNPDGSVSREITDTYSTILSAAQPKDWRAGVIDNKIVGFRTISSGLNLYRSNRQVVEYEYPRVGTYRKTTTFESITSRGQGLTSGSGMDAINGIVKVTVDRSTTTAINADVPPAQKTPEPATQSGTVQVVFPKHDPLGGGSLTDALVFNENVPYPFLIVQGSGITTQSALAEYSDYVRRSLKGQSLGLRLAETLRVEISESWKPNTSFRYYDPRYNTLMSMRGNAHTWSLTPESCVMTVDGLTVGFSDGQVNIPNNVVGVTTAIL